MNQKIVALVATAILLVVIVGGTLYALFAPQSPFNIAHKGNSATPTTVTGGPIPVTVKGCGIKKAGNGYTFSPLHVANGELVSDTNCIVTLKGFNWSQLEFGNGVGGSPKTRISEEGIAWYNQTFHMNVWRIPVNAYWWNTNVNVPLANMQYQDWIQQVVKWAEQNGDYVILTKGPQFHRLPCGIGASGKQCPQQDAGKATGDPTQQTTGQYIDPAIQMWTSIAKLYANDPAVLYDSWNEMNTDPQTWQSSENALIAAIRAQNPRSLVFLGGANFKENINALIRSEVPDFTQPNLVYDFHIYDGFQGTYQGKHCQAPYGYVWKNWPNHANEQFDFSKQHGKAVSISEWGGCNDLEDYNQALTSYARQNSISMVYYDETNVANKTNGTYELTANGMKVQTAYATF